MLEVYYKPPRDADRERRLLQIVTTVGGRLDYREAIDLDGVNSVCLTYEFDGVAAARLAAEQIRMLGEHVEGPCQYS